MKASIVIPAWNGREYLGLCLSSVLAETLPAAQVIVVDNASTDGSADWMAENYPQVQIIRNDRNLGFAGGCNVGLRAARGDVLVLLNQDVIVRPGWLAALASAFADEQVGIAGGKLLEPDGRTLSHAGGYLEWPLALGRHIGLGKVDQGQYDTATDVEYVTGASLAIRRTVLDRIGLLDERFFPAFYEDVDLCWRARQAGWRVRYEPHAAAVHDEASSTRHHWPSRHYYHYRNRLLFVFKHLTPTQILTEFVPAEQGRISTLPPDELRAGHAALVEILTLWQVVTRDLLTAGAPDADVARLLEALRALRQSIVQRQGGDPALVVPRPSRGAALQNQADAALADELLSLWEVREQPFTSQVPILGRWIVAFRNLWNSVSTQWYVRPMLSQQVQFNGAVVRALLQLHTNYWDDDALLMLLAERCGTMATHIADLEARLAQAEEQEESSRGNAHE